MTKRTITLTGRPPVTIAEDSWPIIASAGDKEFDNQYEFQANQISKWGVFVRQHDDGRAIVYATYSYTSNWQGSRSYAAKAGVLLDAGSDIVDAIEEVCRDVAGQECHGDDCERWDTLCRECVADLPAEELE